MFARIFVALGISPDLSPVHILTMWLINVGLANTFHHITRINILWR